MNKFASVKPLMLSLAMAIPTFVSHAQMMPDSTVQVIAYWDKGDKMTYQVTDKQEKIDCAKGDTTVLSSSSEINIYEVIGATKKSYTLMNTSKDAITPDRLVKWGISADDYQKATNGTKIYFKTDEYGSITEVFNIDKTLDDLDKGATLMAEAAYDKDRKMFKDSGVSKSDFTNYIKNTFCNENVVMLAFRQYIEPLFMFHGNRYGLDEEYSVELDSDSSPIKGTMKFRVNSEYSDSTYVHLFTETVYDDDSAKEFVKEFFKAGTSSMVDLMQNNLLEVQKDELKGEISSALDDYMKENKARLKVRDKSLTIIHLPSGWPAYSIQVRFITINGDQGTVEVRKTTREIELIDQEYKE